MLKILKKNGFASMVEIIVTAVIFSLATVGILTTISMIQQPAAESGQRLEAAYVGKQIMDELRSQVLANIWYSNAVGDPFLTGTTYSQLITLNRGSAAGVGTQQTTYNVQYMFVDAPAGPEFGRELLINVTATEDIN